MVLERDSESSDSSGDADSAPKGNNKKKPGKKTALSTRINILTDTGGTKYDLNNSRLRKTGDKTTLEQHHPTQNVRQQEPVVNLGGYPYALVPSVNYPGASPPPVLLSLPPQDDVEQQDVLFVPVTQDIADMLSRTREDRMGQLICEILERQIEQQEKQLLAARLRQLQPTELQPPASVSINISRPPLSHEAGQSSPQQTIQATHVGTPVRVQIGQQGQEHTFQQTLQPPQQQVTFSVRPQENVTIAGERTTPVTIEPLHPTQEVAGQVVAYETVHQPVFQPISHPMLQQPGPPFQEFLPQPYFQPVGQMLSQPMSEPCIQSVGQQASQYIYEPMNPCVVQPAQQFMNQSFAQQQMTGLTFQPMGQGMLVDRMPIGPHQMQEAPQIGQQMSLQVNNEALPMYSLAQWQITQPAGQQPNMNISQDPFYIGAGMQEQLFLGYPVEPKKKKSKKEKSKAESKKSPTVSPLTVRCVQEDVNVPAQPDDQHIKGRRVSQAPVQQNDNDMLCHACKRASIQVSGPQQKDIGMHGRTTISAMDRTTEQPRRTSQANVNQVNDIDNQAQAQNIGLYGGVLREQNGQQGAKIGAALGQVGPGAQCPATSYQRPPYLGSPPILPPVAPQDQPLSGPSPQTQPGPPPQPVPLSPNINEDAAK
ncbi:integrator complex subunit 3 homolog isoform X2 [Ornithodoros turicata]